MFRPHDSPSLTLTWPCVGFLLLISYVTLTFWPWSVAVHGGSRDQPVHHTSRSYACLLLSLNCGISHRIPLSVRLLPLRMHRITWPIRGANFSHIWNQSLFCSSFEAWHLTMWASLTSTAKEMYFWKRKAQSSCMGSKRDNLVYRNSHLQLGARKTTDTGWWEHSLHVNCSGSRLCGQR